MRRRLAGSCPNLTAEMITSSTKSWLEFSPGARAVLITAALLASSLLVNGCMLMEILAWGPAHATVDKYDSIEEANAAVQEIRIRAADGDTSSMMDLAKFYKYGKYAKVRGHSAIVTIVAIDTVQAYKWYGIASACGNDEAINARNRVATKFTPLEIADAERLVEEFKPAEC